MRLTPDQRKLMIEAVRRGVAKSIVARVCGVSRRTLYKWSARAKRARNYLFRDMKPLHRRKKITQAIELSILSIRTCFGWGTARIQQALFRLPKFIREAFSKLVQGVKLSRIAINRVLKRHKLNGYAKNYKHWKFFRAKRPNELWQLDIKGPFRVQGKKYWVAVCIDDYSRYLLLAEKLDHSPKVKEIIGLIKPLAKRFRPKKILTDNNPFKLKWKRWCKLKGIKPLFAHPYYPQDKGKVERAIRNLTEEFINLLKRFPSWLNKLKEYGQWYNHQRFHLGIKAFPCELYKI
jgi:transposase InsO family protein